MSKFVEISNSKGEYLFQCPGCDTCHSVATLKPNNCNAMWTFNGDINNPTISPSLKVTTFKEDGITPDKICHSFINNGMIQFLGDCFHELKNKTVPIPDWNEH